MSKINDVSVVKQQYAMANNLNKEYQFMINIQRISWGLGIGYFQIIELIKGQKY